MTLIVLTLVLVGPYALLTLAGRLVPAVHLSRHARAKVGLSLLLGITGSAHFAEPLAMAEMLPPWVPFRVSIIYATGVLELLAAVGVWAPALTRVTGLFLILMLVAVLPANVYAALHYVPFGGHASGPGYLLVRVPFQLLVIGWVYWATGQRWQRAGVAPHRPRAGRSAEAPTRSSDPLRR